MGSQPTPVYLLKQWLCVCSASSELTISVSSHLEDEDLQQLQQTMKQTLARLTRFVAYLDQLLLWFGWWFGLVMIALLISA